MKRVISPNKTKAIHKNMVTTTMKSLHRREANNIASITGQCWTEKTMVKHYDIESAHLNGDLSYEVYMKQPEGYEANKGQFVCKLMKNLYGLKQ